MKTLFEIRRGWYIFEWPTGKLEVVSQDREVAYSSNDPTDVVHFCDQNPQSEKE